MQSMTLRSISLLVAVLTFVPAVQAGTTSPASWCGESDQAWAQYGACVSTAGDVNGDGFSDVVVGARFYTNGQSSEGRAYLYLGSAAGLGSSPSWTAESDQASAEFGRAVATAGDVNGDGFDDVLVGAWSYSNGQVQEGRVYLYLGSGSGLAPAPAWTWEPNVPDERFGSSVATAGDVNGDGYDDVVIGAVGWTDNALLTFKGKAYVFYGGPAGLAASPAFTFTGTGGLEFLGLSVSTAGDVNGDGFADVLIAAPGRMNTFAGEGRVYAFYGSPGGLLLGWFHDGGQVNAQFGYSVSTAGDSNGDGYSDVIIGAPSWDNGQVDEGAAIIFLGSSGGIGTSITGAMEGNQDSALLGTSVFTAGDVNGDGYSDVIIGTPGYAGPEASEGLAQVHLGGPGGLFAGPSWGVQGNQDGAMLGASVCTAGDVDGDGYSDVIVGMPCFDNGQEDEGRACVFDGSGDGLSTTAAWTMEGNQASIAAGSSVAAAGDLNGDGYSDLVVGSPLFPAPSATFGRAQVYLGTTAGPGATAVWTGIGSGPGCQFGYSVAGAGDLNGDGYGDLVVGDPGYSSSTGRVFVYLGGSGGPSATPALTLTGTAGSRFGSCVASAGDVNDDGFADLVVGADGYSDGQAGEGAAFVYLGSPDALPSAPSWTLESNQTGAALGACVASAGDANGDGFSDVIVAAPGYDTALADAGRVRVYPGSAGGVVNTALWTESGDQAGAMLGTSVACAGDVNGDGYDDVVVGAEWYDSVVNADAGRVYVYHGSSAGPTNPPALVVTGAQASMRIGASVAGAGDVNNDDYSDLVIGQPGWSNGEAGEGRVAIFHGSMTGLVTPPSWLKEVNQVQAGFGESVAGVGDTNGDGFDDVCAAAPQYDNGQVDEGMAFVYFGGTGAMIFPGVGGGLVELPRQVRLNGAPIELLGYTENYQGFQLASYGRSAYGRQRVRMEWNVAVLGVPLGSQTWSAGSWHGTGAPLPGQGSRVALGENAQGLATGRSYHWRLRVASDSPYFPSTPWFTVARSVPSQKQLRVAGHPSAVLVAQVAAAGPRLEAPLPNPTRDGATLRYELASAGPVRLTIHDAAGRCVATLVDRFESAGVGVARWDGRLAEGEVAGGRAAVAGVYFARLESAGQVRTAKMMLAK